MLFDDSKIEEITEAITEGTPDLFVAPLVRPPDGLPESWKNALTARDPRLAVTEIWKPIADRLPRVYLALLDRLQGIALLKTEENPASLIYLFQGSPTTVMFRGYLPIERDDPRRSRLPDRLGDFYGVHDGWTDCVDENNGPRPLEQWLPVEYLWGIKWQLPPGEVSLGDSVAFLRSDNRLALAFDQSGSPWQPLVFIGDGKVKDLADLWLAIDDMMGEVLEIFALVHAGHDGKPILHSSESEILRSRCDRLLQRIATGTLPDGRFPGTVYYQQWSRLLLERAFLETQISGVVQKACDLYRDSVAKWCTHLEHSSSTTPQDLLDFHALAHALGCDRDAAFLGSVPATMWGDGSLEAHQAYALFSLERGDLENGAITVGQLLEMTFEGNVNPIRYDEIVCRLLESLSQRDSRAYRQWRERALGEQPHVDSAYATWISWDVRIAAYDTVAYRVGLINHVSRPLVLG